MRIVLAIAAVVLSLAAASLALTTAPAVFEGGVSALQYGGGVRGLIFTVAMAGLTGAFVWCAAKLLRIPRKHTWL